MGLALKLLADESQAARICSENGAFCLQTSCVDPRLPPSEVRNSSRRYRFRSLGHCHLHLAALSAAFLALLLPSSSPPPYLNLLPAISIADFFSFPSTSHQPKHPSTKRPHRRTSLLRDTSDLIYHHQPLTQLIATFHQTAIMQIFVKTRK